MKKVYTETPLFSLQDMFDGKVSIGDYIEWGDSIYEFKGYDFGTYPIAVDVVSGKQVTLPFR